MIRVADYIAATLARHGVRHVFMLTGGGAMHLNDAIGRCPGLEYVCGHHEQALAIAAESYYRLENRLAALNVTTGPGGTNAITGVYGAWVDSIGMIVVSGQVKYETTIASTGMPLRQLGDQEIDIVGMVKGITKYAVMVTDPASIRYHLEKALHLATSGRPGPTWIDVPMNVQGALVDPDTLRGYDPVEDAIRYTTDLPAACREIMERLAKAERPVIMAGSAIRLAGARPAFLELAEAWGIPVVPAWTATDIIGEDHPCYAGRASTIGDRAGNFAVQNSDFLLVLGCRLNIRQVSYNWEHFARAAYKVIVDIDELELQKPTVKPDLPVHADVKAVIDQLLAAGRPAPDPRHQSWLAWCKERRKQYPVVLPEYWETQKGVNPYCLIDALYRELETDEITLTGDGTASVAAFQAAIIGNNDMRLWANSGCAAMGYDLPAAIGAAIAAGGRRVILITGDGSIQLNLQELQTLVGRGLHVKIILMNNQGYHSIRQTQHNYFPDNIVGCGLDSGLSFPDMGKIAAAYGIPYRSASSHATMREAIRACLDGPGAQIAEFMIDMDQSFSPKLASRKLPDGRMVSSPLEDMWPFLDREELKRNMFIPLVEEQAPVPKG